jgi:hypothetical protein
MSSAPTPSGGSEFDSLLYEPVPEVEPEIFADNDDGLDDITSIVTSLIQRDPTSLREARPSMAGTATAKQAAAEVAAAAHVARTGEAAPVVRLERHATVVDDFIRNFLVRAGMRRTLDAFNTEWYEMKSTGQLPPGAGGDDVGVPDVYAQNEELQDVVQRQRVELGHVHEVREGKGGREGCVGACAPRFPARKSTRCSRPSGAPTAGRCESAVDLGPLPQGARLPPHAPPARCAGEEPPHHGPETPPRALLVLRARSRRAQGQVRRAGGRMVRLLLPAVCGRKEGPLLLPLPTAGTTRR